jgi:MFS family permease
MSRGVRVLAAIGAANALISAVSFGVAAAGPQLRAGLDMSTQALGLVLAAIPAGLMLGTFAWGVAADRIGERRTLVLSWCVAVVALVVSAVLGAEAWNDEPGAGLLAALAGSFLVTGIAGSSAHSAGGRAITEAFPPRLHGRVLSIRHTFIPLGGTLGGVAVPWMLHVWGLAEVLGISAVLAAAVTADIRFALPADSSDIVRHPDEQIHARSSSNPAVKGPSPLTRPDLWLLTGSCSMFALVQLGLVSFLTSFLVDEAQLRVAAAVAIFSVSQLLGAIGRITLGDISDRVGDPIRVLQVLALLGIVLAIGALTLPVLVEGYVLAVMLLVFTSWNGVAVAAAARRAPLGRMGATLGMQTTLNAAMGVVAPIAVGAMLDGAGWVLVEMCALVAFIVAAGGLTALRRGA